MSKSDRTVASFWVGLSYLESEMRQRLPGLSVVNMADLEDPRQRAVLQWDGLRISWARSAPSLKGTKPMPLDPDELHKALDRFATTARGVWEMCGWKPHYDAGAQSAEHRDAPGYPGAGIKAVAETD